MKSVFKSQGKKIFKKEKERLGRKEDTNDFHNISLNEYCEIQKKRAYSSCYGDFFNSSHNQSVNKESSILEYRKYSDLSCTSYLTQNMKEYLNKWQKIEINANYKKLVLDSLSSISTFVKSKLPASTTHRQFYK